jgi:hypothetical protein
MAFADKGVGEDRSPAKPERASRNVSTPARNIRGPLEFSSRAAQAAQDVQVPDAVPAEAIPRPRAPKASVPTQPKKRNKQSKGLGFVA